MEPTIEYERYEVTLPSGVVVLGKLYKGEVCALTYSNRTQAERSAQREGGDVIRPHRNFLVRLWKSEAV